MPNHEEPTQGAPTPDPSAPTQPIRPSQTGGEPIPERVRQPIVVPHHESTIAGLPRTFAVAGLVALVVALGAGFLVGRSVGGDEEASTAGAGRGGGCRKALSLSLQVVELQKQVIANRTEIAQAVAIEDGGQVRELTSAFEALAPAIQEAETQLTAAAEKCGSGAGGGKGKRRGAKGKGDG